MNEPEAPPDILGQALEELRELNDEGMECAFTHPIAFAILSAIQIACQHPEFKGPQRDFSVQFARRIESWLGGPTRPAVNAVMKRGWGPHLNRRQIN